MLDLINECKDIVHATIPASKKHGKSKEPIDREMSKSMVDGDKKSLAALDNLFRRMGLCRFKKDGLFTIMGRTYKAVNVMVFDPRFEPFGEEIGNCIEFIEMMQEVEMGVQVWREVTPSEIPNAINRIQEIHNESVRLRSVKLYPKEYLYYLLDKETLMLAA